MTKKCLISFITYILFSVVCFVSMHLMLLASVNKYVGVTVGFLLLALGVLAFFVVRTCLRERDRKEHGLLAFLPITAIGSGLSMSSLYTHLGAAPTILHSLCVGGGYALLFLLYCLLANTPLFKWHPYICIGIFGALLLAGGCVGLGLSSTTVFSLVLMHWILFISFLATVLVRSQDFNEHCNSLVIASFIGLAVVVVVVLLVISADGGGLDGFDIGGIGGTDKARKKNPYAFYSLDAEFAQAALVGASVAAGVGIVGRLQADDIDATLKGGKVHSDKGMRVVFILAFAVLGALIAGMFALLIGAPLSKGSFGGGDLAAIAVGSVLSIGLLLVFTLFVRFFKASKKKVASYLQDAVYLTANAYPYEEDGQAVGLTVEFEYNGERYVKRSAQKDAWQYLAVYDAYAGQEVAIAYSPKYDEVMLIKPKSLEKYCAHKTDEAGQTHAE